MNVFVPTILIVEDDKESADIMQLVLKPEGYIIRRVSDGQQCLHYLQFEKPELIIMDIMMPVMDGYTAITRISENDATKRIPIIVVTAKAQMEDVLMMSSSVMGVIQKPFTGDVLREKIKEALSGRSL